VLLSFEVEPRLLDPFVPKGVELDEWRGCTFFSLIGFRFLETRLLGCPIPFHGDFPEVNLRFYVRRHTPEGVRRGVVFLQEMVPKRAVATIARHLYGENYARVPMTQTVEPGRSAQSHGESRGRRTGSQRARHRPEPCRLPIRLRLSSSIITGATRERATAGVWSITWRGPRGAFSRSNRMR
jgi:uncharacterized protein YqjF (DUF2071 family)